MKQVDAPITVVSNDDVDSLKHLTSLTNGYILSSVLFSAVELNLFDLIGGSHASPSELAGAAGCINASGMERILYALVNMGLAEVNAERRFSLTAVSKRFLITTADASIVPAIWHHHQHSYIPFHRLTAAIRSGGPQQEAYGPVQYGSDLYECLASRTGEYDRFMKAMNLFSTGVGTRIAELVSLSDARDIYDIGGGGGQISIELLERLPKARVTLMDRMEAISFARRTCGQGLIGRLHFMEGDMFDPNPKLPQADAVVLSAVLGDWDAEKRSLILKNAWTYLRSGGKLIISETLLNDDKSGPANAVFLSLYVLLLTQGGENFTEAQWREFLQSNGISEIEVIRDGKNGFRDLIICTKP